MRTAWIIALLLPVLAGAARAEKLCGAEVVPLLRVTGDFSFFEGNSSSTIVKVIYRNGRLAESSVGRHPMQGPPGDGTIAVRAIPPEDLRRLNEELAAAQIGFAQDCRWFPGCCSIGVTMRVTWYGRGGRINSFLATDDPALPVCSPALSALLNDVGIL
jgi:hypothetical protein